MGEIERRPAGGPPDKPEREQIHGDEIDLTGVVDQTQSLIEVIRDAVTEAGDDSEVPEWGARAMARYLANRMARPVSGLHTFAAVGTADYMLLYNELFVLYEAPDRDDFTAEVINRLGTYLLAAQRSERHGRSEYPQAIREAIAEHGDSFVAYLRLPDVSTSDAEEAVQTYLGCRAGSFGSLQDLAEDAVETLGLAEQLTESGVEHFASIDIYKVVRLARDTFDVVEVNGCYFTFFK